MQQKMIELKEEKEKSIIIVRDFNIPETKKNKQPLVEKNITNLQTK